jgi:hypothetical protein
MEMSNGGIMETPQKNTREILFYPLHFHGTKVEYIK